MSVDANAVNDIIDQVTNPPPVDPPAHDAATKTTDDADMIAGLRAENDRLKQQYDSLKPVADMLTEDPSLIHDLRARRVERAAPAEPDRNAVLDDLNAKFDYEKPGASAALIAEQVTRHVVGPAQRSINEKLAGFAIQNFKAAKINDPFYAAVVPIFDKKIANIDRAELGGMKDEWMSATLAEAWNASLGTYVAQEQAKRPKTPAPVNLGGGAGASGGGGGARTLAEIDPTAYRWAVENGWSQEQMDALVKDME